jgi:hypothetical protein
MSVITSVMRELRRERRLWLDRRRHAKKNNAAGMVIKCDGAIEALDQAIKRMGDV